MHRFIAWCVVVQTVKFNQGLRPPIPLRNLTFNLGQMSQNGAVASLSMAPKLLKDGTSKSCELLAGVRSYLAWATRLKEPKLVVWGRSYMHL
jgi:hypothetical protein